MSRDGRYDELAELAKLGARFHGVSLEFRRSGTDWPMRWRARVVATKNERSEYRLTEYGETAEQAIVRLLAVVANSCAGASKLGEEVELP